MIGKLSIQSKLLLMLLGVCITSIIAIATLGYSSGQRILTDSIFNQLISLRESRAYQIETYFQNIRGQVQTTSEFQTVVEAMKGFKDAYQELEKRSITVAWNEQLKTYYKDNFLPVLDKNLPIQGKRNLFTYFPQNSVARYLQYHYIAANPNKTGEKSLLDFPQDGSKYSQLHKTYNPIFRKFIDTFGYDDLILVDAETGNIVYSVGKEVDFGTNLYTGTYSSSSLAELVRKVRQGRDSSLVMATDFESYSGVYGKPSASIASPIFDGTQLIGILVFKLSTEEINQIMTGGEHWERDGLGKSGEAYLVGSDRYMRSISRFLVEAPEDYFKAIEASGLAAKEIAQIKSLNTSVLHQKVESKAVEQAFKRKTGIDFVQDYRDETVLSAYRPLNIDDLNWIILAEIDRSEAFAPIRAFQRQVLLSTAIIVLLVTLIASILSYYFVKPFRTLIDGFRQVAKGKTDVKIKVESKDEFRELANSFNDMVDSLDRQQQLIKEKNQENEELLLSILPEPVAQRVKEGEESIADSVSNVTVLFADLDGFIELSNSLPANETVTLLNDLVSSFDDAAENNGVEKIRTVGSSYMAVCGLSVPRLDHSKRVIDFAQDMLRILRRFNQEKNTDLRIRIGINSGSVVAGIVGRNKFIYDLWGDTVNIAHRIQSQSEWNTIQISESVHTRIAEIGYDFQPSSLEIPGQGELKVWSTQLTGHSR